MAGQGEHRPGRMLITQSVPNRRVSVTVDFVKRFETRNINVFMLEPGGDATKVTWDFDGTSVFMPKLMSVFVSMDRVHRQAFRGWPRKPEEHGLSLISRHRVPAI